MRNDMQRDKTTPTTHWQAKYLHACKAIRRHNKKKLGEEIMSRLKVSSFFFFFWLKTLTSKTIFIFIHTYLYIFHRFMFNNPFVGDGWGDERDKRDGKNTQDRQRGRGSTEERHLGIFFFFCQGGVILLICPSKSLI